MISLNESDRGINELMGEKRGNEKGFRKEEKGIIEGENQRICGIYEVYKKNSTYVTINLLFY